MSSMKQVNQTTQELRAQGADGLAAAVERAAAPSGLAAMEKAEVDLIARIKSERERYERLHADLSAELADLRRQRAMHLNGVDLVKIQLAEHVIFVSGSDQLYGDDSRAVRDAIADLAQNRGANLRKGYFGTKNYDRWSHQGVGLTRYGYGPKHGAIVFSVGIVPTMREGARELKDEEIEAALYLLHQLLEGRYRSPGRSA